MKKSVLKLVCMVLFMVALGANVAYANEPLVQANSESEEDGVQPRSRYLASGISEITNKGSGVLHIYADFASYESVPWAQITIELQRKKSADSTSWSRVKTYTYTFKEENEPDGMLVYGCADFDESSVSSGYYYRLSCIHKVKTPSGSYESKTTQTDGVLLTSYPDFRSPARP